MTHEIQGMRPPKTPRKRGYEPMPDLYMKIAPHLNPEISGLYTRPIPILKFRECESLSLPVCTGGAGYSISVRISFSVVCQNILSLIEV